jgi:basic amino acid/polyamine antiporter, APA family
MNDDSHELPREFGFWSGAALVAASMIGTGILVTPGYTAVGLGSHVSAVVLWILGGVLAFCGALTLAEMASAMPKVGGEYVYVDKAWGPTTAFAYGWSTLVVGFAGPTAAVAISASQFLVAGLPQSWGDSLSRSGLFATQIFATLLILAFTFVHCLGQRSSAWVQATTTAFKYITLFAFAILGLAYGMRTGAWSQVWELSDSSLSPAGHSATFWEHMKALGAMPALAASALVYISYTYVGWNGAAYVAGETRDATKLVPRALLGGCLAVTALYVAIAAAFASTHSVVELRELSVNAAVAETSDADAGPKKNPLDTLALASIERAIPSDVTRPAFSAVIGLGLIATLSAFLLTGSRVMVAMARSGHFIAAGGSWNSNRNAPVNSLFILGLASTLMTWYGELDKLLNFLGLGLTVLGLIFGTSIFLLRRRSDYQPTFRVPFYPLPPVLYLLSCVFIMTMTFVSDWEQAAKAVAVVLVGAPIYWAAKQVGGKHV